MSRLGVQEMTRRALDCHGRVDAAYNDLQKSLAETKSVAEGYPRSLVETFAKYLNACIDLARAVVLPTQRWLRWSNAFPASSIW